MVVRGAAGVKCEISNFELCQVLGAWVGPLYRTTGLQARKRERRGTLIKVCCKVASQYTVRERAFRKIWAASALYRFCSEIPSGEKQHFDRGFG